MGRRTLMLENLLGTYLPDAGGAIWLGLLVALLLFGRFERPLSARNLALLGLLASAPLLNDIGRWDVSTHTRIAPLWWTALFLILLGHTIWSLVLASARPRAAWQPNLPGKALPVIGAILITMNVLTGLGKRPEDAGIYISIGTQRWLETGTLPYGDPQLAGPEAMGRGGAATYGPVLYLSHIPLVLATGGAHNPPDATVRSPAYTRPSTLGPKLVAILFHLGGLLGLFLVVRRIAGSGPAWGAIILYCSMPYLAGLDAGHGSIAGLRFVSHIAPSALMLLALASASRPFLSGLWFAASAGALFYPVFAFPAWFAWRVWRKDRPFRFLAGAAVGGLAIAALVIVFMPGHGPVDAIRTFLQAVIEHQEGTDPRDYGTSLFGFWGTHPGLAGVFHTPLLGGSPFTSPIFLIFLGCCALACWLVRNGTLATLAAASAAVAAAVQLWKTHGGGTYIEWYLPFLIVALVAGNLPQDTGVVQSDLSEA
ncbi:MAG TPA: hypothetical protein VL241_07275 [Gemmatimonadales bacterium]|nr:hypothetical protein [Gemmatimonadales bacterium]